MVTNKKIGWKVEKNRQSQTEIKKNDNTTEDISETNVSVITKTTNPRIVVQSENLDKDHKLNLHEHTLLKFICLIIMCVIVLITFFISIKTFDMVKDLTHYIIK